MAKKGFQTNVQDLIYSVDSGVGLKLIRMVLYLLILMAVCLVYTGTQFHGFKDEASMDYAQLARNLAEKKSFVTQNVRPQSISFLTREDSGADPKIEFHPDLYRAPLYPFAMAVPMMAAKGMGHDLFAPPPEGRQLSRVFEPERWLSVPTNHVYVFLTGLFLYLLSRRIYNEQVSFWATTLYYLSDMVWADSIAGIGLPMVSCFVIGAFYFAVCAEYSWRHNEAPARWSLLLIASALFAGFAFLTRYAAGIVGFGVFLYYIVNCWRRRLGWLPPLFFLAVFGLVITPWIARNWMVSQSLFGLAPYCMLEGEGGLGDAESLRRNLEGTFGIGTLLGVAKTKWVSTISAVYKAGLFPSGGIAASFFLVSYLRRVERKDAQSLRVIGLVTLALLLLVGGFFGTETVRLCHAFWPLVLLFGVAFFFMILEEMELPFMLLNQIAVGAMVVLMAAPYVLTLMPPRPKMPYPTYYYSGIQHICGFYKPAEVICTDMPWATAWYGNRVSLALPKTLEQFYEINDYRRDIKGLYFTLLTKDKKFTSELLEEEAGWFNLSVGQRPPEFPLQSGLAPYPGQYLLTDYVRWSEVKQREEGK
ncbi:ArnT family glycosyltransferase [Verrucomicrobiota bacterium]